MFTYSARTREGLQAVLDEAKKNAESVEFQALIQDSSKMPLNQLPYRGYTVLNASTEMEEIQVFFMFDGIKPLMFDLHNGNVLSVDFIVKYFEITLILIYFFKSNRQCCRKIR